MNNPQTQLPKHVEKIIRGIIDGRYHLDTLADIQYSLFELKRKPENNYNNALIDVLTCINERIMERPD